MPRLRYECARCGTHATVVVIHGSTNTPPPAGWWEHHGAPFAQSFFCSVGCIVNRIQIPVSVSDPLATIDR